MAGAMAPWLWSPAVMALITCPDCGATISDQAPSCSKCARPLRAQQAGQSRPPAPKSGMGTGLIIAIVLAVLIVPMVGVLAVLGIYGTRKYIATAKTAEAKKSLGQIAKDAVTAYKSGGPSAASGTVKRRICPSASTRVPADRTMVSGKKYQSGPSEWQVDRASEGGFACLAFEMSSPQYYQYEYEATPTGFAARAFGDLNGDGVFSTFEIKGQLVGDRLVVSPSILEIDPQE